MKTDILLQIIQAKKDNRKQLAILLDPDKLTVSQIESLAIKINTSPATHIFVGGSTVEAGQTETIVVELKKYTQLPIILFPGDVSQITHTADAILFLSLLSGKNPEFLIDQQLKAAPILQKTNLEIIPTGYILVDGGVETSVQRVSKSNPIPQNNTALIVNTALAGQYMGKQLIYLEAGSGATESVEIENIKAVASAISVPLIVGGGLRSAKAIENAYQAGADLVVIGTAFENDDSFFEK